jgi:hypothetical protein
MAISQNLGTLVTAMLPAVFAFVAPPGANDIPLKVGAITFGVTVIAALAAMSARETYRIRMEDLGDANAVPMPKEEYRRLRKASAAPVKGQRQDGVARQAGT